MKTAMIWGAAGGIGRALLGQLANEGWTVVAVTHIYSMLTGRATRGYSTSRNFFGSKCYLTGTTHDNNCHLVGSA